MVAVHGWVPCHYTHKRSSQQYCHKQHLIIWHIRSKYFLRTVMLHYSNDGKVLQLHGQHNAVIQDDDDTDGSTCSSVLTSVPSEQTAPTLLVKDT